MGVQGPRWQPERWASVRGPDIRLPPLPSLLVLEKKGEREKAGEGKKKREWRRGEGRRRGSRGASDGRTGEEDKKEPCTVEDS